MAPTPTLPEVPDLFYTGSLNPVINTGKGAKYNKRCIRPTESPTLDTELTGGSCNSYIHTCSVPLLMSRLQKAIRTEVYRRTILLIWPKNGEVGLTVTLGDVYDHACNALQFSTTYGRPRRAVQILAESARRWNELDVLSRILKTSGAKKNIGLLVQSGVGHWKIFCDDVVNDEESNARRDALHARLKHMTAEYDDPRLSPWCQTHEETTLRRKIDAAEIPPLVDRSPARWGAFMRDILRTLPSAEVAMVAAAITRAVFDIVSDLSVFPPTSTAELYVTVNSDDGTQDQPDTPGNIHALDERAMLELLARTVVKEFPHEDNDSDSLQTHTKVLATLVRATIDAFDTAPRLPEILGQLAHYSRRPNNGLVKLCFDLQIVGTVTISILAARGASR
ncbi:hypothetical protein DFH09DRAFT_1098576 [Mycena vulgaris]|nr:hypothetical protein DFH09DRAFT_1098576 [Mycena vulgaris]